jgi:signal transduction histidine kinase
MDTPTFCWFSLEESDNDPVRFWLYFIAALRLKNSDLQTDAPALLQSPEPPALQTVLTMLINDLIVWSTADGSARGPEIVLVLEDYHFIAEAEIHQSLAFLLHHLPPSLHLVMTTRADPPLFRMIQEALNNVGQHADATAVTVRLMVDGDGGVTVSVCDDGCGFHLSQLDPMVSDGHFGLRQMRERILYLGGTLDIDTSPGQGTELVICLPQRTYEMNDVTH